MSELSIAVVGATGLVGTTLLQLFAEREFPIKQLHVLASQQSAGKTIHFQDKQLTIEDLATFDFKLTQMAFFCVGNDLAKHYIPIATAAGNTVIDKSSVFRNDPDVPLLIPEVNLADIAERKRKNIIASPNCNTIPIAVAIHPLIQAFGVKRINIATYQSVSGTGKEALQELAQQSAQHLTEKPIAPNVYPQQIAFNVLPHIDAFEENGYTREEMKLVNELKKIFHDETLQINPTTVRVPVFCGHSAAVHLETALPAPLAEVCQLLSQADGVKLMHGTAFPYPTPVQDAAGNDFVYVGRVRKDISHPNGLNLWIVSDNLRKGAALNAVQIAEHLIENHYD